MREPVVGRADVSGETKSLGQIVEAGRWCVGQRFALAIVLFYLVTDSGIRFFMTVISKYFQLLDIPPRFWGLLGAGLALVGTVIPRFARRRVARHTAWGNFALVSFVALAGLAPTSANKSVRVWYHCPPAPGSTRTQTEPTCRVIPTSSHAIWVLHVLARAVVPTPP